MRQDPPRKKVPRRDIKSTSRIGALENQYVDNQRLSMPAGKPPRQAKSHMKLRPPLHHKSIQGGLNLTGNMSGQMLIEGGISSPVDPSRKKQALAKFVLQ